jgi:hypothetical protein
VRSRPPARLYLQHTLLERLPQELEHMACELPELIAEEEAMRRQRHLSEHGNVAAADQADVGDGMEMVWNGA